MRWLLITGIVIIAIGIAPIGYSLIRMYSHDWKPLSVPVRLVLGRFESPVFKTDIENGRYLLEMDFSRLRDLEREKCEIGIPMSDCGGVGQAIDFD